LIKTKTFYTDLSKTYYSTLNSNSVWLFGSDYTENAEISTNTDVTKREFLNKLIFGKKISSDDISYLIKNSIWEEGTIYNHYDDKAEIEFPHYTVSSGSNIEQFDIFKCISNAYNSASLIKPEFSALIENGYYYLPDGYAWKYMGSVQKTKMDKFSIDNYIPVTIDEAVKSIANTGIYNIIIENRAENFGYERITGAVQNSSSSVSNITRIFLKNIFSETSKLIPSFEIPNSHINKAICIFKTNLSEPIETSSLKIIGSGIQTSTPFVDVVTPEIEIEIDDLVEILPYVEIKGDGTGCQAITIFDEESIRINSILILTPGMGYKNATCEIIDPVGFDETNPTNNDVKCILRPIISPSNGHGSNILEELLCDSIGISTTITSSNSIIPNSGFYSKVALIKNPIFSETFSLTSFDNRLKIEMESELPPNIEVGSTITQNLRTAEVHEVDYDTNSLYLVNYVGAFGGNFTENDFLQINSINYDINSITYSPYTNNTGDLLFIVDVNSVERTDHKKEQIRFILNFEGL
jgi:hypothetical protein